nr:hypothetical protein [PVC group bacterium]
MTPHVAVSGFCIVALTATCLAAAESNTNLLRNPGFRFHARDVTGRPGGTQSHNVACWNCDAWGDITVGSAADVTVFRPTCGKANVVRIRPGKRFYQFATLPEIGCQLGDPLSFSVPGYQRSRGSLRARMTLMRIESADGTWSPADLGISDKRVFSRHGRGELVPGPMLEQTTDATEGAFTAKLEGLKVKG